MLSRAAGETLPRVRASSACSGFPGINRGMKKFSVIAAQSVNRNMPRRRTTNLTESHSLRGLGTDVDRNLVANRGKSGDLGCAKGDGPPGPGARPGTAVGDRPPIESQR